MEVWKKISPLAHVSEVRAACTAPDARQMAAVPEESTKKSFHTLYIGSMERRSMPAQPPLRPMPNGKVDVSASCGMQVLFLRNSQQGYTQSAAK
jgi:hypothetical protein